jgi:hypothetical protein
MAAILTSVCLALLTLTALAFLWWRERRESLRVRLQPALAILISLLILWGLVKYGDVLLRWIKHWLSMIA